MLFFAALCTSLPAYAQQGRTSLFGEIRLTATAATLTGALGGVELTLADSSNNVVAVVNSVSGGGFIFQNVTSGVFTITPRKQRASFFPSVTTVTVSSSAQVVNIPRFEMLPELPTISGRVILLQNNTTPFPFANITLTNTAIPGVILRTQVQNDGTFRVAVSTAGTYTISPEASALREGFIIVPQGLTATTNASTTAFVDASGNVSNNQPTFVASLPTYRLSGSVRFDYEPSAALIDVTMLSPTGAPLSTTRLLASVTGEPFSIDVTNASYRITSSLTISQRDLYAATPSQYIVHVRSRNIDTLNFVYEPRIITIRGRITRSVGLARLPVGNLPIRLAQFNTNIVMDSASTNADGNYTLRIRALDNNSLLTLLLPPTDFTFTYQNMPLQLRENVVRGSIVALLDIGVIRQNTVLEDIIATPIPPREYRITGRIVYRNGIVPVREPITAIVTNATNSMFPIQEQRIIRTDENGGYTLSVTAGSYRISLLAERHIFSPPLRTVNVPQDTESNPQNFQAILENMIVMGIVQTITGEPITNATIRLGSGGVDGLTVQTDVFGRYRVSVPEQFPENRFTLVPSSQETTFYPPARLVVVNFSSPTLMNMDFRATSTTNTLPLSTISGRITTRDNTSGQERGLSDVIISDGTRTTRSDADGNYVLQNVPNGTYTLTASLNNYAFTPPTLSVPPIIGGTRPRNQNFFARFQPVTFNRAPIVQTQPNDIPVIAATTTRVPFIPLFNDPNGDELTYSSYVEDPTILRTRMVDGFLLIDALTEGNTMVNVVANDNRGGTVTASFRVTVNRPVLAPRLFTRPRGNINTNFNASLVIQGETVIAAMAGLAAQSQEKESALQNSMNGELGAFNSNCECVGSVVWTGGDVVLPIWAEDRENKIPGMRINEPIDVRFIDNIERKSRRTRLLYLQGGGQLPAPGAWPIDQGIINNMELLRDDPCVPVLSSVFSAQNTQRAQDDALKASVQPNPASLRAHVRYTLPAFGNVTVELWNTLGQRVSKVFEGQQSAGTQSLDLNLDALPTGMYLCRIRREGTASSDISTLRISVIR
jgi:hypothetical protein